jgi:MerR family glutamine synthetase transcriptional repressor
MLEWCKVSDEIRRNMALFSIGTVMKLTDLTARQIRYYEQHELIVPARTNGNQRLFSFNDVERLLQIKALIEKGVNIAGIKQVLNPVSKNSEEATVITDQTVVKRKELDDKQLHKMLKRELLTGNRRGKVSLIQGELSRFLNHKP